MSNFLKMVSVNTEKQHFISLRDKNHYTQKNEAALQFILPPFQSFDITNLLVMSIADEVIIICGLFCSNCSRCILLPCNIPTVDERQIKESEAD